MLPASRAVTAKLNDVPDVAEEGADTEKWVAAPTVLLSEKFTAVRLPDDAVTVYGPPAVALAVNGADAMPEELVVTVVVIELLPNRPDAPDDGAVNVTLVPDTGLFPTSFTVTESAVAKAVLMAAECGVAPAFAVIEDGAPAVLLSEKFTAVRLPDDAVTVYGPPAAAFAVNGADATPEAFVVTVIVFVALLNVPDAPDDGAVNVTLTPDTGLLPASFTVTASAFPNAVETVADCGVVPTFAVIEEGAPAVLLSEKFTAVRLPDDAVTVYGPPAAAFAVNGADAMPEELVVTVVVIELLPNRPDAPDDGAVNVTLTPFTGFPAASFTVTESAVPNTVLMAADCGEVPEPAVMLVGTCTTGKDTVPLVAEALAPPPETKAALVTVGLTAVVGTSSVMSIRLKDAPPATACVLVQVIE